MDDPILILTECGTEIGLGHLTRCLSLAEALEEAGKTVQVWVEADEITGSHLQCDQHTASVGVRHWYGLTGPLRAQVPRAAGVVIDSFRIGGQDIRETSQLNPRIAVIDDFPRRQYESGIVIDWTVGAQDFAYPERRATVTYLLGSQYCALRPEFRCAGVRSFAEAPRSILVSFGGADVRSLAAPVVNLLQREFPDLEKRLIVGPAYSGIFSPLKEDGKTTFHIAPDGKAMQQLMTGADIGICGGGQTVYEFASQGLPAVMIRLVDDQDEDIRGFARAGFGLDRGWWNRPDLEDALIAGIRELHPARARMDHAAAGRRLVDGLGASRLAAALLSHWGNGVG